MLRRTDHREAASKRSAGYYAPEERSVRRIRCLTTTLAVEIVKPTPRESGNESVVRLAYMTASTNIERTINTEAIIISRAAVLMPQCCRSTTLVSPLATTPSTVAGKTYATRANQRAIPELKGIIVSYLPMLRRTDHRKAPKRSAGYYRLEERSVRRIRCLTTTLAVEIVKPTPNNTENETSVRAAYMTPSRNIERTMSTDAIMISRAAALSSQCCRSTILVSAPATTPSTLAGKTYTTRKTQRTAELKGIIVSYLPCITRLLWQGSSPILR
jgi:hypothetical protein